MLLKIIGIQILRQIGPQNARSGVSYIPRTRYQGDLVMLKSCKVLAAAVFLLAGTILFQLVGRADTAQLTITGTPTGYNMGGVYTSPYSFIVAPTGGKPFTTDLICDDFTTDIGFGYSWKTNVYTLADVTNTGPQKFFSKPAVLFPTEGVTKAYTTQQEYDAVAWLAVQLLDPTKPLTAETQDDLSYAIWQIFDPTAVLGYQGTNPLSHADQAEVASWMTQAFAAPPVSEQIYIYTPNPSNISQEFIGVVPEGSTLAHLAFDSLALLGIMFFVRRRIAKAA
jgi:hypothetical protein